MLCVNRAVRINTLHRLRGGRESVLGGGKGLHLSLYIYLVTSPVGTGITLDPCPERFLGQVGLSPVPRGHRIGGYPHLPRLPYGNLLASLWVDDLDLLRHPRRTKKKQTEPTRYWLSFGLTRHGRRFQDRRGYNVDVDGPAGVDM